MHMTKSQAVLTAKLVEALRPDWQFHGVMAALAAASPKGDAFDVAVAAITAAADPDAQTPGVIPTDGHHWPTWTTEKRASPADLVRKRTDAIRSRRVLDELQQAERQHNPASARAGYLAARQALEDRSKA